MKQTKIAGITVPKLLVKIVLIAVPILFFVFTYASFNNRDVDIRTEFEGHEKNRTTSMHKMKEVFKGNSQIIVKFDESYHKALETSMDGRKDSEQLFMKWIQESNPNADIRSLQELYANFSRVVESERKEFAARENTLSMLEKEHKRFLQRFPNNFYNLFMKRKPVKFTPIVSDEVEKIINTGKENNTELF